MKDQSILIKVSLAEKELIKQKAESLHMSMSDFVRMMTLNGQLTIGNKNE